MVRRIASALTLATLILAWTDPAFALTRWASYRWTPASGSVAGYAVYASNGSALVELVATVVAPAATVPVASSTYLSIRVAAFDASGRLGPLSEPSYPVRLCPGDFDGDELAGINDWSSVRSCLGKTPTGFCAGADFNDDGAVGLSDIRSVNIGSDACAAVRSPKPCPGDFDGDKAIGLTDWYQARTCNGLPAIGACAAGDFDGNGTVSMFEVNFVSQMVGSTACAQ